MAAKKTIEEINEKIKKGRAIVLTAEEVTQMAKEQPASEIAKKVDVVTTATFGPMCSSGVFVNFGHPSPPIRMERVTLNDVPVCSGIAAVDINKIINELSRNNNILAAVIIKDDKMGVAGQFELKIVKDI